MPVRNEYTSDGRGMVQTGWGVATAGEILREMVLQNTDPLRPKGQDYVLIDFTQVTEIDGRASDIMRLILEQEIAAQHSPNLALAIAAESDGVYGMARMWEGMSSALRWRCGVFRTRTEAVRWLARQCGPLEFNPANCP